MCGFACKNWDGSLSAHSYIREARVAGRCVFVWDDCGKGPDRSYA